MDKLKLKLNIIDTAEKVFLYLFAAYAILSSNSFSYGTKAIGFVLWPSFILGFLIVLYRVLNVKDYRKATGFAGIVLMLASIGASVLVNYKHSLKQNLIICIFWCFYFIVLYITERDKPMENVKKDIEQFGKFFVFYTLASTVVSFYLMFTNYAERIVTADTDYEYFRGFTIGRLWGTYINPNNGAISAAISVIILVYFIFKNKKIVSSVLCSVAIFVELMYIALSDSRSGAVAMGVALAVFSASYLLYKWENKNALMKLSAFVIAIVLGVTGFLVPRKLKDGYNSVVTFIIEQVDENNGADGTDDGNGTDKDSDGNGKDSTLSLVDRGYDLTDDISNRRFDVWKGAVEAFADSPRTVAVGYSYKGFTEQILESQPENYLVNNDYTVFTTLDNEVFNILVSQGAFGIIAAAVFLFAVLKNIFKNWFKQKNENKLMISVLMAGIVSLAASAMFCSVMFYHNSPNTVIFWLMLGGLMHILKHGNEDENNE